MNDASPRPPRPDPMAIARRITEGFGPQVKRLRQARAMTQTDLGNAAYLTVDHIGKIERGTWAMTIEATNEAGLSARYRQGQERVTV